LENDEFVQDFSQKSPSTAVTHQTEKKMVLKEIVVSTGWMEMTVFGIASLRCATQG
jgi:hypothetical protein